MSLPLSGAVRCHGRLRPWVVVGATLALWGAWSSSDNAAPQDPPATPQAPAVTFKVDINYVEIPAVVVDRNEHFVDSLRQSDFQVYEDGRRQTIATFSLVETPVEKPQAPLYLPHGVEADVQTNTVPFDGRLYVLVLDDLHVRAVNTAPARDQARRFIENHLGAGDLMAVVCTSGRPEASQDFTANRRLLVEAVDHFMGRQLATATENRIDDYVNQTSMSGARQMSIQGSIQVNDREAAERTDNARRTLSTIRRLSNALAAVHGRRKAVVLISEGIDAGISEVLAGEAKAPGSDVNVANLLPGATGEIQLDARDTIAAATRANVTIYGVDPTGLSMVGGLPDVSIPINADPALGLTLQNLQNERELQHESLRRLSSDTGGFAAVNTNDLRGALERIRQDNSRYYLLGYYASDSKRDGKFHQIDVKVNTRGLSVRTRAGYLAPRAKEETPAPAKTTIPAVVQEVLDDPLPVPGLRMTVSAAAFRSEEAGASVTIVLQIDGRDLRFKETGGRFESRLGLAVLATDPDGRTRNSLSRTITMPLRPESYKQVAAGGIRIVDRLELPHGRYRLRVAAEDLDSQRVGSVHYDIDVPDFDTQPIAMSDLLLTSSRAGIVPTAPGDEVQRVHQLLPGPPTVARTFRAGETIALTSQVYDHETRAHTVDVATTLRSTEGHEVFRREESHAAGQGTEAAGSNGFRHTAMVPLTELPAGLYVLSVEARSRTSQKLASRRDVRIEIAAPEPARQ